jgi:hypothetical protein
VYDLTENQFFYYKYSTSSWVMAVGPQGPQGPQGLLLSGTSVGVTPYWNGSQWVVNSTNLFHNGTNVGIGVTPTQKLDVNGAFRLRGNLFDFNNSSGTAGQVITRGASGLVWAAPAGNVSGNGTVGRLAYWSSAANIAALPLMNYNTTSQFVEVTSKTVANDDDPIFEVKNKDGIIVFGVYQTGVRIYVDDDVTKTGRGGFAVGGFTTQKDKSNIEYLRVTPDSVRVYIDADAKKTGRGGFAVGGFTTQKAGITDNFFNIETASAEIIPLPGEPRILWYPLKEAFMAGRVIVQHPDSVGTNSWASGYQSKSVGNFSQALGYQALARKDYSTAIGKGAIANGDASYAFGSYAVAGSSAKGNSYAIGAGAKAFGSGSYAIGSESIDTLQFLPTGVFTSATGDYSFAIGLGANSSHIGSLSLGVSASATANYANALGNFSKAEGVFSTAIGNRARAIGGHSIALNGATTEGYHSIAAGMHSRAQGNNSVAIGQGYPYIYGSIVYNNAGGVGAFALGYANSAAANHSFAIGYSNYANGDMAIAIGANAYAQSLRSVAVGQYHLAIGSTNTWVPTDPIFVVGNGAHSEARNNAFTVLKNGNVGVGPFAPTAKLHTDGTVRFQNLAASTNTRILTVDVDGNLSYRSAGSWAAGTTNVTGSGTANYLSKWSGTYAQTNSIIFDNGTNVGIGTASPIYKLQVAGTAMITPGTRSIIFEQPGADPIIRPSTSNYGTLGTADFYYFQTHTSSIYRNNEYLLSDKNVKKDIKKINNALDKVLMLNGYSYGLNQNTHPFLKNSDRPYDSSEKKFGFIAQELMEVIPEMVVFDEETGFYMIKNHEQMLPVIIEAMKEQQTQIKNQAQLIQDLINRIEKLESDD